MGHIRLGRLPRSKKWRDIVHLLTVASTTADIAAATLEASKAGLESARHDTALVHSFWLLTQLPLCAREPDYLDGLDQIGVTVGPQPTVLDVVGAFSEAVDLHLYKNGGRTDLGEMAQMGAAETLTFALRNRVETLFGANDVQAALAQLGTPTQFSHLARAFFARVTERYLTYFLSRELSIQLGSVRANREFREALSIHCQQASKIVEKFAEDWFSKANYQGRITPRKAAGFVAHAMTKLQSELARGAGVGER